jgi:branched-chain amino acid transport system ATP-binding protein
VKTWVAELGCDIEPHGGARSSLARRAYVLNNGHVVFEGTAETLQASSAVMNRYLGV